MYTTAPPNAGQTPGAPRNGRFVAPRPVGVARRERVGRLAVPPPLPPAVYGRRPAPQLPFPIDQPGCVMFARGRHAIWHGVRALALRPDAVVLVPAYHCGTEVEALLRAGVGCRFYEATDLLAPDEDELAELLDERVAALYLIHYLGFPQDVLRWRRWCDAHGLLLIEDAAQGWLGTIDARPMGSFGDLSIFTFYKTLGVPDGAAALARNGFAQPARRGALRLGTVGIRHAEWLLSRSALLTGLEDGLRAELQRVHREVDPAMSSYVLGDPDSPPARTTRFLLPRLVDPALAERRRANYERLLAQFGDVVAKPFARLSNGACPWAFMIDTEDKQGFMERLLRHRIRALNFWSEPHPSLPAERFPQAGLLRARLVGLPVHQELRDRDLARLGPAVSDALHQGRRA
ncbi:MAG: DegT/DnrJ/EryC1/StrS family aminotransferase [Solirubrobacteraceae bacterium]